MKKSTILIIIGAVVLVAAAVLLIVLLPQSAPVVNPESSASAPVSSVSTELKSTATFKSPSGLLLVNGVLCIADSGTNSVIKHTSGGDEVIAGNTELVDLYGNVYPGYLDGAAADALFGPIWDIETYLEGFAVTDPENNAVRYISDGMVYTVVGNGEAGYVNSIGTNARLNYPTGITRDDLGNLYVADTGNNVIRKIDTAGNVTTFAGSTEGRSDGDALQAKFFEPTGLCWKNGTLYVADSGNHRICAISGGKVATVAGGAAVMYEDEDIYAGDYLDGNVNTALFDSPQGIVAADDGSLYIADTCNGVIRRIAGDTVTTVIESAGDEELFPISPRGITIDGSTLYVADTFSGTVAEIIIK